MEQSPSSSLPTENCSEQDKPHGPWKLIDYSNGCADDWDWAVYCESCGMEVGMNIWTRADLKRIKEQMENNPNWQPPGVR